MLQWNGVSVSCNIRVVKTFLILYLGTRHNPSCKPSSMVVLPPALHMVKQARARPTPWEVPSTAKLKTVRKASTRWSQLMFSNWQILHSTVISSFSSRVASLRYIPVRCLTYWITRPSSGYWRMASSRCKLSDCPRLQSVRRTMCWNSSKGAVRLVHRDKHLPTVTHQGHTLCSRFIWDLDLHHRKSMESSRLLTWPGMNVEQILLLPTDKPVSADFYFKLR